MHFELGAVEEDRAFARGVDAHCDFADRSRAASSRWKADRCDQIDFRPPPGLASGLREDEVQQYFFFAAGLGAGYGGCSEVAVGNCLLGHLLRVCQTDAIFGRLNDDAARIVGQRIVVLHHGEKIAEGRPEEISRDPRVVDAYLGEEFVFADA